MAMSPVFLVAAGVVALMVVVAGVRVLRHRGEVWSEDYDVFDDELKVQLLRELEAAAEEPVTTHANGPKLVHFAEGSGTLSAGSSTTAQAETGYGDCLARREQEAARPSIIDSLPRGGLIVNGHSIPTYVKIPQWQSPLQQKFSAPTAVVPQYVLHEEPPLFVNAKQFHRILKRRAARQAMEEKFLQVSENVAQKGLREKAGGVYGSMRRQRGAERRSSLGSSVEGLEKSGENGVM